MRMRSVVLLSAAGALLAGCASSAPAPTSASAPATTPAQMTTPAQATASPTNGGVTTTSAPTDACAAQLAEMSVEARAAQLVMMGIQDSLDSAERAILAETPFGSTILLGRHDDGVLGVRNRVDALAEYGGATGMLVAIDQEGGLVQRATGPGFDTIPAARDQAQRTPAQLTEDATRWGSQLAEAGIWLNLAPVADVVPAHKTRSNQPVGALGRGYGADPETVAAYVTAFIDGMHAAGVGTSAKHFPGLGEVEGNTDHTGGVVDSDTTAQGASLEPFRAAIAADSETVMIATAVYDKIDPDHRGAFSAEVIGLLRADLGYDGVIISDDLGAAQAVADVPGGERAIRFVRAGGDLAISASPSIAQEMVADLVAAADADPDFAHRIDESALRVLHLKRDLGVTTCAPE